MATDSLALPLADEQLAQDLIREMTQVEDDLRAAVANADSLVDDASRHLVSAGGKRLRPLLTLLVSQLGTGISDDVRKAAVVVELTHLASLYHDDVMDSAPLRRGAPSAHEVWGNNVAILTGDLLFARASALTSELGPEAVGIQARTFERLCMGQLQETLGPRDGADPVTHYIQVLADKTASLLATSALFGAKLAGAAPEHERVVTQYGELVGVAFQLADDVIDLTSTGDVTGKTQGTDLREGVPTMPVLLLRQIVASPEGTPQDGELLAEIDSDLSSDEALASVVEKLRVHRVVDMTRQKSQDVARQAIAELDGLPDGSVKDALVKFAEVLVDRVA
ncbi:polyprenyl synthetase family protein [Timonella senegalensis]|uniref:polyprenyl synthetase family protein n=3 Tax=Timonella senegalensis TaxID=1465825 RepID=UPI002FE3F49A